MLISFSVCCCLKKNRSSVFSLSTRIPLFSATLLSLQTKLFFWVKQTLTGGPHILFFFAASHLTVFLTSLLNKHASCRILDRRVLRSQISDVFENIFTYLIKIRRNYRVNLQCVDFWFQNLASDQMLALTLEPWFHNINLSGQHCPNIAFQSFLETYCLCPTLLHLQSTGLPSFLQLCRVSLSKIRKISITFPVVLEMHCILFLITILPMIYAMLHKINFIKRFEACMAG